MHSRLLDKETTPSARRPAPIFERGGEEQKGFRGGKLPPHRGKRIMTHVMRLLLDLY